MSDLFMTRQAQDEYSYSVSNGRERRSWSPERENGNRKLLHDPPSPSALYSQSTPLSPPQSPIRPTIERKPYSGVNADDMQPAPREPDRLDDRERRIQAEWDKLAILQDGVTRMRVYVQQQRTTLRMARDRVANSDRRLMDLLRVSMDSFSEDRPDRAWISRKHLDELYGECLDARDALGPLEEEYNTLELRLGAQEYAVDEKTRKMQTKYDFQAGSDDTYDTVGEGSNHSEIQFESASSDVPVDDQVVWDLPGVSQVNSHDTDLPKGINFHMSYGTDVSVGELPGQQTRHGASGGLAAPTVAKESIRSTERNLPNTAQQTSTTPRYEFERHDINYAAPDLQDGMTWKGWRPLHQMRDTREEQDRQQSRRVRQHFDRARRESLDVAHSKEHDEGTLELHDQIGFEAIDDVADFMLEYGLGDLRSGGALDGSGHSLLLKGLHSQDKKMLGEYILDFDDAHQRVNRWLLHKLRVSNWEILQLHTQVEARSPLPRSDWTISALALWDEDDAAMAPQAIEAMGRSASVTPSPSLQDEQLHASEPYPAPQVRDGSLLGSQPHSTDF